MALSLLLKTSASIIDGVQDAGTSANIDARDDVSWDISGATQTIEILFDATNLFLREFQYAARYTGHKDDFLVIQAYHPVNLTWDEISSAATQINSGLEYIDQKIPITDEYKDGSNIVTIRVVGTGLRQAPLTYLDFFALLTNTADEYVLTASEVADAVVQRMPNAVYQGTIYIDTVNGTDGTDYGISGTAQYPVKTLGNAMQLADTMHTTMITVMGGSAIVLDRVFDGYSLTSGAGALASFYTVDFAGFSISQSSFEGASISGTYVAALHPSFKNCIINNISGAAFFSTKCVLSGTITVTSDGAVTLSDLIGTADDTDESTFKFASPGVIVTMYQAAIRINIAGMVAGNNIAATGDGVITFDVTCLGGDMAAFGNWNIVDEASGLVTIIDTNNFDRTKNAAVNILYDIENLTGTIPELSLASLLLSRLRGEISGGYLIIKAADGVTTLYTLPTKTSETATPIIGVGTE